MKAKKFCIIALVLAIVLFIAPISESRAEEEPEVKVSGDYYYIVLGDETACIKKYNGNEEKVIVPDKLDEKRVTGIGDGAFSFCENPKEITIPESVKSIGEGAFFGCINLTEIKIPDAVEKIGDNPFYGCEKLLNINISADHPTLEFIDNALIYKPEKKIVSYLSASKESKYEIPDGIESIAYGAFSYRSNLTEITIPDSVEKIGKNPFNTCFNLSNIEILDNHPTLEFIDNALFYKPEKKIVSYLRTSKESKYEIPDGIESIGEWAFTYCTNLTEITIPESVKSIGESAFLGCINLKDIEIPDSVQSIGEWAFSVCTNLTEINIPESVKTIGKDAFEDCNNLTATVEKGSFAEEYCKENNVKYKIK